ncbi:universal stress protein [Cyanothece sp. BG0011]|uniref:universal stress protein n=1 Tax=Cyanothece sp. BG0011 TaxID=2082950 RepID=UPI000D1D5B7C|nr:universal stress protein [Cyanothece sp. BG0011]
MMYKKILVALASPDDCQTLFPKALTIAKKNNSLLKLFHCINSEVYFTPYGTFTTEEVTQLLPQWQDSLEGEQQQTKQWLTEYAQKASSEGIAAEWDSTMGNPSSSIVKLAKKWDADLIIMGRRGLTGLEEMLLGSVSNYVVHHAPCSVLLVQ